MPPLSEGNQAGPGFDSTIDFEVSIPNGATHIWAGLAIAQSKSNIPGVITSFFDFFLEGGTEVGFDFTRTVINQESWAANGDLLEKAELIQVSGDVLDVASAALNVSSTFNPSGKKWWFSINDFLPGTKNGIFRLTVRNNAETEIIFANTFDITLTGT